MAGQSSTTIEPGSLLAARVYGAAVLADILCKPGFMNTMTGPAPKLANAAQKLQTSQTSSTYPFILLRDLTSGKGAKVTVDLFHSITGKPVMGNKTLEGRLMSLSGTSQEFRVNQVRGGIEDGGRMTQHSTVHSLRVIGRANMVGWYNRYLSQLILVQISGARGDQDDFEWIIPTETDPDFNSIIINPLRAPSYDKHWFAGDATSIADMDDADALTLHDVDRIRALLDELVFRLPPVMFEGDASSMENPLYIFLVGPRSWHHLKTHKDTSDHDIRHWHSQAMERGRGNPLFSMDSFLWNGMLVRPFPSRLSIRFNQGSSVTVTQNTADYQTTTEVVPTFNGAGADEDYTVERNLVLGAQAAAIAFGKDSESGTHFRWFEQKADHASRWEGSVHSIMGVDKLAMENSDGIYSDHGLVTVDAYAPKPGIATNA